MPLLNSHLTQRTAMGFVILLGLVSLFGDMTYEGARSVTGPYLEVLGASATAVGVIAGGGELVGYGLRLLGGYLADRSRRYWLITIGGYALNLLAVPALALAGRWEVAGLLLVIERTGKGLRTPARDLMLSQATSEMGRGWGFGLHEAMDQLGAVSGPLILALIVALDGGYRVGFAVLLVPAVLALAVLLTARRLYPRPEDFDPVTPELAPTGLPRAFWLYMLAAAALGIGFADFPLIAFDFERRDVVGPALIPVYYAVAMGGDAVAALLMGRWYDRAGLRVMVLSTIIAAGSAPLAFSGQPVAALAGVLAWSVGLGAQESVLRAAVAGMVGPARRATAYGIFNAGFGLAWFAGSVALGVLYDRSLTAMVLFAFATQLVAAPLFLVAARSGRVRATV